MLYRTGKLVAIAGTGGGSKHNDAIDLITISPSPDHSRVGGVIGA